MVDLNWTEESERWLRDIFDYIAAHNRAAAAKVVAAIHQKAQLLGRFPEMGYRYRQVEQGEIRILLYGHFRIAYLHYASARRIDVLGVFHGAMQIERYLG